MSSTSFTGRARCRAKNPGTCAYHGNPIAPETQAEALATSETVLTATKLYLMNYEATPDRWNHSTVQRIAHLITAVDAPKFTRDILKARYDIDAAPTQIETIEAAAGSMYRYRMTYTQNHLNEDKRSSKVQGEQDLADSLETDLLQAEYEADLYRGYAAKELNNPTFADARTRRDRANHEMARSIAASAHAFRLRQLCENLSIKVVETKIPDDWAV